MLNEVIQPAEARHAERQQRLVDGLKLLQRTDDEFEWTVGAFPTEPSESPACLVTLEFCVRDHKAPLADVGRQLQAALVEVQRLSRRWQ